MRRLTFALAALLAAAFATVAAAETIGAVGYKFKWIGPNDKIVVEAFDDPEVAGVACYLSRADIGGVSGAMG
ncbi:MAG: CreA family protein, partial [Alphaproteobacteria bacterium]|nr:CreA family protein [Alphaproteobacteria bacterium]